MHPYQLGHSLVTRNNFCCPLYFQCGRRIRPLFCRHCSPKARVLSLEDMGGQIAQAILQSMDLITNTRFCKDIAICSKISVILSLRNDFQVAHLLMIFLSILGTNNDNNFTDCTWQHFTTTKTLEESML